MSTQAKKQELRIFWRCKLWINQVVFTCIVGIRHAYAIISGHNENFYDAISEVHTIRH